MSARRTSAQTTMRMSAAVYLDTCFGLEVDPAEGLTRTAKFSRDMAALHSETARSSDSDLTSEQRMTRLDLASAGVEVAEQLEASHARLLARRATSAIPESRTDDAAPAQRSEWFECDRAGCGAVIGAVGGPDDEWGDYDPIGEHIAGHERDDADPAEPPYGDRILALGLWSDSEAFELAGVANEAAREGREPGLAVQDRVMAWDAGEVPA